MAALAAAGPRTAPPTATSTHATPQGPCWLLARRTGCGRLRAKRQARRWQRAGRQAAAAWGGAGSAGSDRLRVLTK